MNFEISDIALSELEKIIDELEKKLPFDEPFKTKWQLSSTMLNSIYDLKINNIGYEVDFFNLVNSFQVEILRAFEENNRIIINKFTRQEGISTALAFCAYHYAYLNSGKEIIFISKNDQSSKRWYDLIAKFLNHKCYKDKNLLSLHNGTKIRFSSEENAFDIIGITIDLAIIDDGDLLINPSDTVNNILIKLRPVSDSKIIAIKWPHFSFSYWKEVK